MRVDRDPFEPIMCILKAESQFAKCWKITDEILRRTRVQLQLVPDRC
jgi:hypothetical protein